MCSKKVRGKQILTTKKIVIKTYNVQKSKHQLRRNIIFEFQGSGWGVLTIRNRYKSTNITKSKKFKKMFEKK